MPPEKNGRIHPATSSSPVTSLNKPTKKFEAMKELDNLLSNLAQSIDSEILKEKSVLKIKTGHQIRQIDDDSILIDSYSEKDEDKVYIPSDILSVVINCKYFPLEHYYSRIYSLINEFKMKIITLPQCTNTSHQLIQHPYHHHQILC